MSATYISHRMAVDKQLALRLTKATNVSALGIQGQARKNASGRPGPRVDTGMLRRSIRVKLAVPGRLRRKIMALVGAGGTGSVDYAAHLELGTRRIREYPFLRPAAEQMRRKHAENIEQAIRGLK